MLAKHSFHFFITVKNLQELIVPDQIQLICEAKNPRVRFIIRIKEGSPEWAFPNSKQEDRFDSELIDNYIGPLNDLQMAYVCGPNSLCKAMVTEMKEIGISNEKIFLV
jgi:NAD(P)H-flavin reductase